ncbi:MAG: hypothetical protein OXO53_07295 [Chloroflexota bacterium]|nr:hypothetical protein [Chloroflexota bacterium]
MSDAEWAVGREACGTARQVSQALLVESEEAKQAACGFIRFSDLAGDAAEARPCLTALRAGLSLLVSRQDHLDRLYPEEVIDEVAEEVVMPAYLDAMEAELDALEVYLDALDAGETDRVEEAARDYQAARGAVRDAWDAVLAAAAAQQLTPG